VVFEDLQIANGVRERVPEPRLDPARRERVEFFAARFRKIELALPDPSAGNGEFVGDRHRQLVYRRLVLISGRQSREVSQQERGSAEERQSVFDGLVQGDAGFRKTLAMRREAASARRWPCAERLAPNRLPDATGAAAGPEAAKERV
jgi:hypothetical protein